MYPTCTNIKGEILKSLHKTIFILHCDIIQGFLETNFVNIVLYICNKL